MWSSSFPVEASDVCLVGSGPYARCPRARALAPPQVRLVENGSQLAARSYAAASLGTEAWAQVGEPRFHSTGLFAATALLLSGFALSRGACSRAGRLCGLAGATGGSDGGDVELDVHWDLADYEMDPGGSGVSPPQGRSRYVPPSV
ncbi:unnamed protein product [Prorocentrum cordatum]|uniref:Uncharacterized protein n=1 Tax=Prorocentrum cordatum TaxID=2364126 RepID=A0ABN9Q8I2_9DINO|nr:unnamed protein product [Polarella glacialis]